MLGQPVGGLTNGRNTLNCEGLFVNNVPPLRRDVTDTIGEIGYPGTSTALAGATPAPTMAGNGYYHSTHTGALTVSASADAVDGQWSLLIPATVTAASVTGATIEVGSPGASVVQVLTVQRMNGNTVAHWAKA